MRYFLNTPVLWGRGVHMWLCRLPNKNKLIFPLSLRKIKTLPKYVILKQIVINMTLDQVFYLKSIEYLQKKVQSFYYFVTQESIYHSVVTEQSINISLNWHTLKSWKKCLFATNEFQEVTWGTTVKTAVHHDQPWGKFFFFKFSNAHRSNTTTKYSQPVYVHLQ